MSSLLTIDQLLLAAELIDQKKSSIHEAIANMNLKIGIDTDTPERFSAFGGLHKIQSYDLIINL